MGKRLDLSGHLFGRLTAIAPAERIKGKTAWTCICECGNAVSVTTHGLRTGDTRSCGCLKTDMLVERNRSHNKSKTRTYRIWNAMLARCRNQNHASWPHYGGRGIGVCEQWSNFTQFLADMGEAPHDRSIDRIDNNKGYSPDNCRWANNKEQAANKSNNHHITINGETKLLAEWCKIYSISAPAVANRIKRGWSEEKAITTPTDRNNNSNYKLFTWNGETKPIRQWAASQNLPFARVYKRISCYKWPPERALELV